MKTAISLTLIIALLSAIIYLTEYRHPADLAALRADHIARANALDQSLADSQAERDHLEEQLAKAQTDLVALSAQLKAAQAEDGARALLPASTPEPEPQSAPAPALATPAATPSPPAPDPRDLAEIQRLQTQLAALQARQRQVQTFRPTWSEQSVDSVTGRKTGIRTSDATRQKFEAQRTAELQRVAAEIATAQRRLAEIQSRIGR